MAILSLGLLLASLLCCSFSQAPGDGDPLCINEMIDGSPNTYLNYSARPVYPATVWPLMDSRDYVNLLLGRDAVWQQVDQDTNNTPEIATNWFQLSSIPCQGNVLVCGFSAGVQENWLITQHISRQLNSRQMFKQISVKIVYNLAACNINRNCKQSFDLYKWETSTISSEAARRTENYIKVGTYTPMVNSSGTMLVNETMDVIFTTEETGVYLALVDEGTCVVIQRLFVFYEGLVCPDHTNDLINHPPILAPQDMAVGRCVANSSAMNGLDPLLHCTDEGLWEIVAPCLCNAGYESKTIEGVTVSCSECPVGTFSDTLSNDPCQPCPANSEATQTGLIECPCHRDYYRAATEESSIACTQSPSAPLKVSVSNVTNTSVFLSWLPPEYDGGRNLSEIFYMVRVSGSNFFVMTIKVNTTLCNVMGLTSGVQYTFSITAENAVSSWDRNINARTATVTATTSRGVPSRVLDVQEHCTVVVWKEPANTNGLVTNYFVTFSRGQGIRIVQTDATYHYYVIRPEDIPPGTISVTVEVRAQNEAGLGERGPQVSIDCLTLAPRCPPPVTCPTCSPLPSPQTCPICPNCSDVTTPLPVSCPTCPPSPTCPPNVTCSTDLPTLCPDCETCPTSTSPTSCSDCPKCPNVTCPTCPPLINCSTLPSCPTPTCSTCPPPTPCQPCEACPTSPATLAPVTCPKCDGCPAEEVQIPGSVTNVRLSNCNQLLWDLPGYGGKCISEYRVRIFNGRTYGSSKEKRVFKSSRRNLTLTWLPKNGTASIIVRAKNNVGFSSLWSFPIFLSPGALSCAQDANDGM